MPQENTLKFNSKFESGNLHKAIKINENTYTLLLNYDTETKGHTQWYYFSVKNYKNDHTVQFNITNLMKNKSLYNNGMKPLVYSVQKAESQGIQWHRDCTEIKYYQNDIPRKIVLPSMEDSKFFYTLSFSYTFDQAYDTVFFAYCYPYTYTDLKKYLKGLEENLYIQKYLKIENLSRTIAGNECFCITITDRIATYGLDESGKKPKKVSTRRSWMKNRTDERKGKM